MCSIPPIHVGQEVDEWMEANTSDIGVPIHEERQGGQCIPESHFGL